MKQKYCLRSVVPFNSINQSLSNRSRSKQAFSFSKSIRFSPNEPSCPISTYRGNDDKPKNTGAIIGYGKKVDITHNSAVTPGSNRYQLKTIFDNNKTRNKGYSLGLSREKIAYESYIDQNALKLPGVGKYHLETETAVKKSRAPAFTLRKKTKILDVTQSIQPQNRNPSPAHYENNPENYRSSFSSNFKRLSYSGSKSKRFFNADNKVPGPGEYENNTNLSNKGKYVMSSHHGGTRAKFDNSKRVTQFATIEAASRKVPGPGSYRQSSEFGQYDGNVYGRSPSKRLVSLNS